MLTIRTWAPVKDNDLYTTPGLDTKMKMIRSGISHPIIDFFNIQVTKIINKSIYRKYSIENYNLSSCYMDTQCFHEIYTNITFFMSHSI